MVVKNEKLQYKIVKFLVPQQKNCGIVVAKNMKDHPYNNWQCNTLFVYCQLHTYSKTETFSTHISELWRIQMFINHLIHCTLINKRFIADTTAPFTLCSGQPATCNGDHLFVMQSQRPHLFVVLGIVPWAVAHSRCLKGSARDGVVAATSWVQWGLYSNPLVIRSLLQAANCNALGAIIPGF